MNTTNSIKSQKNSIKLPNTKEVLNYKIETKQSITFMDEATEDTILTEVSKQFIKKDDVGSLYKIIVTKRTQNNLEDSRELGAYLERLNEKVFVYINDIGQIISIPNIGEINEIWTDIRYDFKQKFKKSNIDINEMVERMDTIMSNQKNFLALYRQTEVATLLFPPIFIEDLANPNFNVFQHKVFPFFFGKHSLPFKLLVSLTKNHKLKDSHTLITRVGLIDNTIFSEEDVRAVFRKFYSSPLLPMDVKSNYSEIFYINLKNHVDKAIQKLNISLGEVYKFNQFTSVSQLQ